MMHQSEFDAANVALSRAADKRKSLINIHNKRSLFVSHVSKCRGETAKWQPFQDYFGFYSEPANQKPRLIVSGPRKDAKPSVNDKLHSYSVSEIWSAVLILVPLQS